MILDWSADWEHADQYDVLDAETGEPLPMGLPIVRADDEAGVLVMLKRDASGAYVVEGDDVAREEVRRAIRIVRKPT